MVWRRVRFVEHRCHFLRWSNGVLLPHMDLYSFFKYIYHMKIQPTQVNYCLNACSNSSSNTPIHSFMKKDKSFTFLFSYYILQTSSILVLMCNIKQRKLKERAAECDNWICLSWPTSSKYATISCSARPWNIHYWFRHSTASFTGRVEINKSKPVTHTPCYFNSTP